MDEQIEMSENAKKLTPEERKKIKDYIYACEPDKKNAWGLYELCMHMDYAVKAVMEEIESGKKCAPGYLLSIIMYADD